MTDFKIGQVKNGVAAQSSDALSVTSTLSQTVSFQKAMSNPIERDVFLKGLEARKEKALANNDKTMFGLLSAMAAKVKNYSAPATDIYSNDDGFKAIG